MKDTLKKINIFLLFCLFFIQKNTLTAQQEQHFTQFMYNKLAYNPAYAGSNFSTCLTALHRSQWIGFEGAPSAQLVSFDTPLLNGRVGVGGNLIRQTIGVTNNITVDGAYAYRVPVAHGNLSVGLQASARYRSVDFNDSRLIATTTLSQDAAIEQGLRNKLVPNFGVGAYYNQENFYIGLSAPRLIKNNIGLSNTATGLSKEERHIYAMAGLVFDVSDNLKLQPQALFKYAKNTPFDAEANVNAIFADKYTFGMSYRFGGSTQKGFGESIDFLTAMQLSEKFWLGLSYDYSLSELRDYNAGSLEVMLRYCIRKSEGETFVNPRFF
jgi:type IX secretion system PorP/SprF family membrane protein